MWLHRKEDMQHEKLRVLLVCGSGASSGFMAANIRKAAKEKGIEMDVQARSDSEIDNYIEDVDLIMVGPHLEYVMGKLSLFVAFLVPFNYCEEKKLRKQRLLALQIVS